MKELKELLEIISKIIPNYLLEFVSVIVSPKISIVSWVEEEKGNISRPVIFVAISVCIGYLVQYPRVGKTEFSTIAIGLSVFKLIALMVVAAIIHLVFKILRGSAKFSETFSVYLYIVSPLYLALVVISTAMIGILRAYSPDVGKEAQLEPLKIFFDDVAMQTFQSAEPNLAYAYIVLSCIYILAFFIWFVICWGAFRKVHRVSFGCSALAAAMTLPSIWLYILPSLTYVLRGILDMPISPLQ